MSDVSEAWKYVTAILADKCPAVLGRLASPAAPDEIAGLEATLGVKLPDQVHDLFKIANGSQFEDGLIGGWRWLTLDQVQDHFLELRDIESDDPSGNYNPETSLPLFYYEGDVLYVELLQGNSFVYYRDHEAPSHREVADSLAALLQEYGKRMASGLLVPIESNSRRGTHLEVRPPNRSYWPPDFNA